MRRGRERSRREPSDVDEAPNGVSERERANQSYAVLKKIGLSTKTAHDEKAGAGIEPANSGFADRSLTTWLPRH